ncbi:MAG: rhodanese-like domain-containing protein, partial [Bacteroidia bacterium]|nr:rhodanese-like domain-containing protein [Bacteroidia bacterium]NNM15058.1 rhodanese-like domain-containing protein [Bacteroidia bacterium]
MKHYLVRLPGLIICWVLLFAGSCNETKSNTTQDQKQEKSSTPIHKDLDTETFKTQMAEAENAILIDIRTPQEVSEGYIKNAKN